MKKNKKIRNQYVSILLLLIYCFGSSSLFVFHNHNNHDHDHHDHHDHVSYCENIYQNSEYDFHCSHEEHLTQAQEICILCDHFSNCEPEILDNTIKVNVQSFSEKKIQLCKSFYLHDFPNYLNKSPPFII